MARRARARPFLWILVPAFAGLASCGPKPLSVAGPLTIAVQVQDPALAKVAEGLSGMRLDQSTRAVFWYQRFLQEKASGSTADIYLGDWGQELFYIAKGGGLAKGGAYWRRGTYGRQAPAWLAELKVGPTTGFLPTTAYMWGLFINSELASRYMATTPSDLEALESLFEAVSKDGLPPIALGSAYGWPGAAWFTLLDLRLNGASAANDRYDGKRPFNDAGAVAALTKLAAWRDKGWLSPDADRVDFRESLRMVESGKALCVLAGTSAYELFANQKDIVFMAVPYPEHSKDRSEIVGLDGFVLPSSLNPEKVETAYAFADACLKNGTSSPIGASYKVPLAAILRQSKGAPIIELKLNMIQSVQAATLAGMKNAAPAFDRAVSPQALQSSIALWAGFFKMNGDGGSEFADKLQKTLGISSRS